MNTNIKPFTPASAQTREKPAVLLITKRLHTLLKAKAREEGHTLQGLVEKKLAELVAPEALQTPQN